LNRFFGIGSVLVFLWAGPIFAEEPETPWEPTLQEEPWWTVEEEGELIPQPLEEDGYSDLGVEQLPSESPEDLRLDQSAVPGAVIDSERTLSTEEAAALPGSTERSKPEKGPALEQVWKQKGYDRPPGPEEKEKRPETIFGGQYDIQEELRKVRDGSY
jgi:hypothetical protein